MTDVLEGLLDDLKAEGDQLRTAVTGLDESADGGWATPTPAAGWTVATQVAHLLWTDETAATAARSVEGEEAKAAWDAVVMLAIADPTGFVDTEAHEVARLSPRALLARWGTARDGLVAALRSFPAGQKMPWFGPPMSPASMATARFMETWAHALDVYETLGVDYVPSDRIRHVAHLGVRTRDFAYGVHEQTPPRRAVPRRADRTLGRDLDLGTRGRRPAGHRPRPRLLPAGHPARAPRRHRPGRHRRRRRALARHRPVLRRSSGRGTRGDRWVRCARSEPRGPSASATAPASTATASRPCARCSRAPPTGRGSTASPVTTSPS